MTAYDTPQSAKMSTFSHKKGVFVGVGFKSPHFGVQKVHFFWILHPPPKKQHHKISPGYGPVSYTTIGVARFCTL